MKFLMDASPAQMREKWSQREIVAGQLLTPLTGYATWDGEFAIDNGAFTGLNRPAFDSLLRRNHARRREALFVVCPDIVGSARRTLELWKRRQQFVPRGWRLALAAQNGLEDCEVPWDELAALFIGGTDPWKDSRAVKDLVLTAKALGKHVHVGRVNTAARFIAFESVGADTCDGSGVVRYDHMLARIESRNNAASLFEQEITA